MSDQKFDPNVEVHNYPEVKAKLAKYLQKNVSDDWDVYDYDPINNLYLVHYNNHADMTKFGNIRGHVIHHDPSTDKYITVCKGFSYTPTIQLDYMPAGIHAVSDNLGKVHIIDPSKAVFKRGHKAVTIRVFYFNKKIYYSTYRRLDIYSSGAKWGNSSKFSDMYDKIKAPRGETLYDMSKTYSPIVHLILLVHPELADASKEIFTDNKGYAMYVGHKRMMGYDYPEDQIDTNVKQPHNLTTNLHLTKTSEPGKYIYTPGDLNVDKVNYILRYGWFHTDTKLSADVRLYPGEFIVAYLEGASSTTIVKIQSTSYTWRNQIGGNDTDLYHRFCVLMSDRKISHMPNTEFYQKYPNNCLYSIDYISDTLKDKYLISIPDNGNYGDINLEEIRSYQIWISFILSVPYHRQKEVSTFYHRYFSDQTKIISYIYDVYKQQRMTESYPERLLKIIELARTYVIRNENTQMQFDDRILHAIKYLIGNEYGDSLYKLFKHAKL